MLLCCCHDHASRLLLFGAWTVILCNDRLAVSCAGDIIGPYLIEALSDERSYAAAMITLCDFSHSVPGLLSCALIAWLFPVQVASLGPT